MLNTDFAILKAQPMLELKLNNERLYNCIFYVQYIYNIYVCGNNDMGII